MKEINLDEIKERELGILIYFDRLCNENNLHYFISGGTLIGAVRHSGFIPWDDDIDVGMPRPDYQKLIETIYHENDRYGLAHYKNTKNYYDGIAKIYDKETIIIDENADFEKMGIGVFIDIFPVDGLGNSYQEAIKRFQTTSFQRELLVAKNWRKYKRSLSRAWYYEPIRFILYALSRVINGKRLINSIERHYKPEDYYSSQYASCIYGLYRKKEILPKMYFETLTHIGFEGHEFCCSVYYDEILKTIYGNYMQLPPKEKQVSNHQYQAYLLE